MANSVDNHDKKFVKITTCKFNMKRRVIF